MSGTTDHGMGWLPVEARDSLEAEHEKASAKEAERLLALPPRERVLALLERATCRSPEELDCPSLTLSDLRRVLESFPGEAPLAETMLEERFAEMIGR